jgi:Fic family protein
MLHCELHTQFVLIHPFLDGNGRLSRVILTQQVMDLFDGQVAINYPEGKEYYNALTVANTGDNSKLEEYFGKLMTDK